MIEMWKKYEITLNFIGRLCGSVPANKEVIQSWLESRQPNSKPPSGKSLTAIAEEVINKIPDLDEENQEISKKTLVVFETVENKLAVRAATLRAHLKDCAGQIQNQFVGKIKGERNFTTKIKNGLYVTGGFRDDFGTEMIFILKDKKQLTECDGFQDRLIHAKTPMGQINALKRFAYIVKPSIKFTVQLLGNSVKLDDLNTILQYGGVHGYGGERSQQEGQYTFNIKEVEG